MSPPIKIMEAKEYLKTIKVMIATPHYENKAYCQYVNSLTSSIDLMNMLGIKYFWHSVMGDSYVERAKNSIVGVFKDSDCTHLLMIDSDMSWDGEGFLRILSSKEDFVAGAYPCKNNWNEFGAMLSRDNNDNIVCNASGLAEAEYAPGGFFKLSRYCIEQMWEHAVLNNDWYIDVSASYKQQTANLFHCKITDDHRRQGEDVTFCETWKNLGGKIYIEPRIKFGHSGIAEYFGCFQDKINDRT